MYKVGPNQSIIYVTPGSWGWITNQVITAYHLFLQFSVMSYGIRHSSIHLSILQNLQEVIVHIL